MSLVRMKKDMHQAIANGIKEYNAKYNSLIFNEETSEFHAMFWFAEQIKIKIQDNQLLFNIRLNQDRIDKITEQEMQKIKENDIRSRTEDLIMQKFVTSIGGDVSSVQEYSFSDELVADILAGAEEDEKYREIEKLDKIKLKAVKDVFENDYNLKFEIYDGESFAYLDLVQDEVILNKNALNSILQTLEILDTFIIAPQYNEEDDTVTGVRLFFGIDLSIEEE